MGRSGQSADREKQDLGNMFLLESMGRVLCGSRAKA